MLRLKTFGGLQLAGPEGPLSGPPSQRRRLALLAILAAAGHRGVSRDRLLLYLWPESDQQRARHALAQLVYALRRDLGDRDLVLGTIELRLDPSLISADITDFHAARAAGDLAAAAALYSGPFLDGFHLDQAEEFERWVQQERDRVRHAALETIETLAEQATRENAPLPAVRWWRRLSELEPLNPRYAGGLVTALAFAGDRPGALREASSYQRLVQQELGAPPDASFLRVVEALRRAGTTEAVRAPEGPPRGNDSDPPRRLPSPSRWTRPRVIAAAAVVLTGLTVLGVSLSRGRGPSRRPVVAIGLLQEATRPDSLRPAYLLTDMLATGLSGIPDLEVIATSRLSEILSQIRTNRPAGVVDAARRAGASDLLEGMLQHLADGRLRLEVHRVALDRGALVRSYQSEGRDLAGVMREIVTALAADFDRSAPPRTLPGAGTASPLAARFYEEGLRAYDARDLAGAYRFMGLALREDSAFAMAAYQLWRIARYADPVAAPGLRKVAAGIASRAADRERWIILAAQAAVDMEPAAAALVDSLLPRYPSDPDAWLVAGEVRFTEGDFPAAIAAYARAIRLDSAGSLGVGPACRACDAWLGLATAYLWSDSAAAGVHAARRVAELHPGVSDYRRFLAELLWRAGPPAEALAALRAADSLSGAPSHETARSALLGRLRLGEFDAVDRECEAGLRIPVSSVGLDARWIYLISLRYQGRLKEARALAKEDALNQAVIEFEGGEFRLAADGFHRGADAIARGAAPPGARARTQAWLLTHAATALAAAGDTALLPALADTIQRVGARSLYGRDPRLHHYVRGLLEAARGRHEAAVTEFRQAVMSWTDGYTRINLELARSLLALGRPTEAVLALEPALRGGLDGSNLYVTRTELHELLGRAFDRAGRVDSARAHYAQAAQAWRHADPAFQDRRRAVEEWLARHR